MSALVGLAVVSVLAAVLERRRRSDPQGLVLEHVILGCTVTWCAVGLLAVGLAVAGRLSATTMMVGSLGIACVIWPWNERAPPWRTTRIRLHTGLALVVLLGGAASLRLPTSNDALAGRDQGTYLLRAQQLLRSGEIDFVDPVLRAAGTDMRAHSGGGDIVGLYPKRSAPNRAGSYEASYRPGWYLTDRDGGHVVPQFLHLLPATLATGGMVVGAEAMTSIVLIQGLLAIAALWAIARRLLPEPWAWSTAALYATTPLVIWVHRTTLTEVGAGLLLLATVLAALRADDEHPRELPTAALCLGTAAWLRGNGWLWAPVVLACLWLTPGHTAGRRKPILLYGVLVLGSLLVHTLTAFPYLYDEFHRQLAVLGPLEPLRLLVGAGVLAIGWLSVDELVFHRRPAHRGVQRLARAAPLLLGVTALAAITMWLLLRGLAPHKPFARLDPVVPLLGAVVPTIGLVGALWALRRVDLASTAARVWLLATVAVVVFTLCLYAQRNLPQLGLYYYGRYLVPEIVPVVLLATGYALSRLHVALRGKLARPRIADAIAGVLAAASAGSVMGVLLTHPTSRMAEFEGVERIVESIAAALPPQAVVIAGGEGWHHGHTFNQVGGALAIGHGVTVLPYRTREAAYATAYALLVTQPEATGRPAPPVFLLLGEATHHYRRDDQVVVAAVDDTLEPPLRARSIELFEMFADRLTPVDDQVPTGVTRDGLRMALMQLEIDPDSAGERRLMLADRPPELDISEGPWGPGGAMCLLPDRPRRIVLPQLGTGPRQIVLVAAPGTAAHNHRWMIEIDGERRTVAMPSASPRARDTLGPLTTRRAPQVIALTGSPKPTREAACPHGGLFELRVLDPSRSRSVAPEVSATTFAPPRDLGHAVTPTVWVSGRGLSRYRAGIEPEPDVRGVSLRLHTGAPLQFAPELLPDAGAPVDLIVTLTQTRLDPAARLLVALDDTVVAELDPPDEHAGTWQSKPLRIEPDTPVGRFSLALRGASEGNEAWVRDIGLFSRQRGVRSALEPSQ